jgi:hypothetical protein
MTHRVGPGYQSLRIEPGVCLNCGNLITGAGSLYSERVPGEGDIMVCLYCSHLMEWTGVALAELSEEAIKDIAADKDVLAAVAFATEFQRWRKQ